MKALVLNCSLKSSSEESSTEALSKVLCSELAKQNVEYEIIRVADHKILPGVSSDEGSGDEWPAIRRKILDAQILVMASPTWVGRMSSMAQKVLERMDAMLSETDDQDRPIAYNRVAGFVATGNEDGAKHVIAEMMAALAEIGFTIPAQPWTYYNQGAPMGPPYIENKNDKDKERPHQNAATAAANLAALARALQASPIPPNNS